ncbi:hypothetical protein O181_001463 [Austropuccinia psidii MF-1]|uniref:Uncharacterized protein n=1 Tax=Austropuccinia psidii MF-1 TaxID=1389203 RepID=A0A9Q3BAK3_9BASI|nr:hypothetical protein [Austropuccinia psidii MF-1]
MESIVLQRQGQKGKELVEEPKYFISRTKEGTGNDPSLGKKGPVVSNIPKPSPEIPKDKPKRPQKKQRGLKNNQGAGKGKDSWNRP